MEHMGHRVENQRSEVGDQRTEGHLVHMPSASLGHYASLSFIVKGEGRFEIVDVRLPIADHPSGNSKGLSYD